MFTLIPFINSANRPASKGGSQKRGSGRPTLEQALEELIFSIKSKTQGNIAHYVDVQTCMNMLGYPLSRYRDQIIQTLEANGYELGPESLYELGPDSYKE